MNNVTNIIDCVNVVNYEKILKNEIEIDNDCSSNEEEEEGNVFDVLLPDQSKALYLKNYQKFNEWKKSNNYADNEEE